jgi:hypothetical protein
MTTYQATPKGLIRGAIIDIEELLAHGMLNEQQQQQVIEDAQRILQILGEEAEAREPEPGETAQSLLKGINAMLDVADLEQRQLNAIEIPIVIDNAQGLLGLFRKERHEHQQGDSQGT